MFMNPYIDNNAVSIREQSSDTTIYTLHQDGDHVYESTALNNTFKYSYKFRQMFYIATNQMKPDNDYKQEPGQHFIDGAEQWPQSVHFTVIKYLITDVLLLL